MMTIREYDYSCIESNRCTGSFWTRTGFHLITAVRYLHRSIIKSILSRVIVPIFWKLYCPPRKDVNEGRSTHSSTHSISLRIVNVFL